MKKTKFNWKCAHCGKRNIDALSFQFDVPHTYEVEWECDKCGKDTKITFSFTTDIPNTKP
jgi:C4-type Zn-finger protein